MRNKCVYNTIKSALAMRAKRRTNYEPFAGRFF